MDFDLWQAVQTVAAVISLGFGYVINRDQKRNIHAIQIKLNKIIEALPGSNAAVGLEKATEEKLNEIDDARS